MKQLFFTLFLALSFPVCEGVTYSQPVIGTKDYVYIHGGVKFEAVPFEEACLAKLPDSDRVDLFLVDLGEEIALALCDPTPRGLSSFDPYLISKYPKTPDFMVTTKTFPLSPLCDVHNRQLHDKKWQNTLSLLWASYDAACSAEFGADFVSARPSELAFFLDGLAPVLGRGVKLAGANSQVLGNVHGGYVFWASGATNFANQQVQSYHIPWELGVVYSDCYGGILESIRPSRKDPLPVCSPVSILNNPPGLLSTSPNVHIPGHGVKHPEEGPAKAPVICRRFDVPIKTAVRTPENQNSCSDFFGSQYTSASPETLMRYMKSTLLNIPSANPAENSFVLRRDFTGEIPPTAFSVHQDSSGLPVATEIPIACDQDASVICAVYSPVP